MFRAEALGTAHSREAKAKQVEQEELDKARIKSEYMQKYRKDLK